MPALLSCRSGQAVIYRVEQGPLFIRLLPANDMQIHFLIRTEPELSRILGNTTQHTTSGDPCAEMLFAAPTVTIP